MEETSRNGAKHGIVSRRRSISIAGSLIVLGAISSCASPRVVDPKNIPDYDMGTPITFTSPHAWTSYTNEVIVHSATVTDAETEDISETGLTLSMDIQWKITQGESHISDWNISVQDMQSMDMESMRYPNDETWRPTQLHAGEEMRGVIRTDAPHGPFHVMFRDGKGQSRAVIRLDSSKLYSAGAA